jgi:hypothetical protein
MSGVFYEISFWGFGSTLTVEKAPMVSRDAELLVLICNTVLRVCRVFEGLMQIKLRVDLIDRLCGLVVRVSGYRYRGLGFDSRRYQIF